MWTNCLEFTLNLYTSIYILIEKRHVDGEIYIIVLRTQGDYGNGQV